MTSSWVGPPAALRLHKCIKTLEQHAQDGIQGCSIPILHQWSDAASMLPPNQEMVVPAYKSLYRKIIVPYSSPALVIRATGALQNLRPSPAVDCSSSSIPFHSLAPLHPYRSPLTFALRFIFISCRHLNERTIMANYLASIFGTEQDKVNCSFYYKIGACRHGDRCSRKHVKPSYSQTVLMPNMYQNPAYDPKSKMNPSQLQNHFDAFYEDVWCEMCKYGELEELVVCDNNNDRKFHPCLFSLPTSRASY